MKEKLLWLIQQWWFWLFVVGIAAIFFVGCGQQSKIEVPIPGNGVRTLTGKAADAYASMMVANEKTSQGLTGDVIGGMKKTIPLLVLTMVGGLIFWGLTRSRFGWVIPASAIAGITLILAFARWSNWITGGVIIVALALLVWKAYEYQKERGFDGRKE